MSVRPILLASLLLLGASSATLAAPIRADGLQVSADAALHQAKWKGKLGKSHRGRHLGWHRGRHLGWYKKARRHRW